MHHNLDRFVQVVMCQVARSLPQGQAYLEHAVCMLQGLVEGLVEGG